MAKKQDSNNFPDEGEELELEEEQDEAEALVAYEIASYPSDLTLWGIRDMWKQGDIVIPEFQRNFVWSIAQASLLIESFLIGLPVPQVFFYIDEESKSLVIDGQQRIVSTVFFFDGYFGEEGTHGKRQVFRLTGLDDRSPFSGKRFEDLSDALQRKLKGSVLRAINIRQLSPKKENTSIYHIFERLNTGGTPLKAQEIRNCVFRGGFIPILRNLNKNSDWRKILGKKTFDKHQKDIELLLRVFALSNDGWETYVKPMKEYLNMAMNSNKSGDSKRAIRFQASFPKATALIVKHLGVKPFHIRGPLNSSALDAVICTIIDNLDDVPDDLDERFEILSKDKQFVDATYYGTSDTTVLQSRFKRAKELLID